MRNIFKEIIENNVLKPLVDSKTSELAKENKKLKGKLEEKQFDMLSEVNNIFGVPFSKTNQQEILGSLVSWAYTNINAIAEAVSEVELKLYRYKDNKVEEIFEHDAIELLYRVNDYTTQQDHFYTWAFNRLACGESYWYLVGRKTDKSIPTEIWSLQPRYMKPIAGDLASNEFIKEYWYEVPGKKKVVYQPHEILFFKKPNPYSTYRGYGVLEAAMSDVLIDKGANEYSKYAFENFARPDGVLQTESRLSDEVINRLKKDWDSKYKGARNTGKTAILEQGLKYQIISQSNHDMQFLEQQQWTRDKLMAMFRNTKMILGITEDVNRANAEAGEMVWIKHTIKPILCSLVEYLNEFYVPMFGDDIFFDFVDPSPESVELKIQEYTAGVDKWITRNEIRERENLEPVEGGDSLYRGLVEQDISETNPDANNSEAEPVKELKAKPTDQQKVLLRKYRKQISFIRNQQYRNKKLLSMIVKSANKANKAVNVTKSLEVNKDGRFSNEVKEKQWYKFIKVTEAFETQVVKAVNVVADRHKKAVMAKFNSEFSKSLLLKGVNDVLPKDKEFITLSLDLLTPLLVELAKEQGNDILAMLGLESEFIATDEVLRALERYALLASRSYVGTLRQGIKAILINGVKRGDSPEVIGRKIRAKYTAFNRKQALTIARTETIRAANYTNEQAFIQSNVVSGKEWFTSLDERVCPYCIPLNNKVFDLKEVIFEKDSTFTGDSDTPITFSYDSVIAPPLHPNCRCTLVPVIGKKSAVKKIAKANNKHIDVDIEMLKTEVRNEVEAEINNKIKGIIKEL